MEVEDKVKIIAILDKMVPLYHELSKVVNELDPQTIGRFELLSKYFTKFCSHVVFPEIYKETKNET